MAYSSALKKRRFVVAMAAAAALTFGGASPALAASFNQNNVYLPSCGNYGSWAGQNSYVSGTSNASTTRAASSCAVALRVRFSGTTYTTSYTTLVYQSVNYLESNSWHNYAGLTKTLPV